LPEDSVRRLGEEKLDPADPELDGRGDGTSSELMRLLRLARPKWRDKDVYAAADKLRSIGIVEVAELHESIESELEGDDSGVNRRLLRSGQRTFAEATLYALRFNPKANRGEVPQVPPVFSERRPRRRGRMSDAHANGEQRSEQVPALGPFRPKSQPVTHRVRPRAPRRARRRYDLSSDEEEEDDEEEHEQEEDEEEDEEEDDEEAESDFSVPDADAVWIASEDTVYGPTYATEHHAPRARASPTQGCHGTSSDSGGEDQARGQAENFRAWLDQRPVMRRLNVPERADTGIAWDFPLAKSEKRELLLQHIAVGERMAQQDASEAAKEAELAYFQQRKQRQSLEFCRSQLRIRRKSVRRRSLGSCSTRSTAAS